MRQICLNRPFLWPQAVDTITKNHRQIREIQLHSNILLAKMIARGARRGPIDFAFRSRPIEVHFISGQNLCRRRRLCVQQDIFWHLHGINQKRRRPPPRLYRYIYIYRVYICAIGIETEVGPSTFVAIYTTQLSLVGFQRGHLINNARKLCEIAFTMEFPGGVASCGQWRSWQGVFCQNLLHVAHTCVHGQDGKRTVCGSCNYNAN